MKTLHKIIAGIGLATIIGLAGIDGYLNRTAKTLEKDNQDYQTYIDCKYHQVRNIGVQEFANNHLFNRPYKIELNGDGIGTCWYEIKFNDDLTGENCTINFDRK